MPRQFSFFLSQVYKCIFVQRSHCVQLQNGEKVQVMQIRIVAVILAALMCAASVGAIVARPSKRAADERPKISLESMIPSQFGDWRNEPQRISQVINPQTQEL
jgi:hypothetical protein